MKKTRPGLFITALIIAISGCTSSVPEHNTFLLRHSIETTNQQVNPPVIVSLGNISIPAYLKQSGIVLISEPHQIHRANNNHWAEPLNQGIRNYLKSAISDAAGFQVFSSVYSDTPMQYRVDIEVTEFHGTVDGKAVLICSWRLTDSSGKQATKSFEYSAEERLQGSGYPALVAAEKRLLYQLADTIARHLKTL